jgi:hypothetical protein
VVDQAFSRGQPHHPLINTGPLGIAIRILGLNLADFANCRIEENNVNVVMVNRVTATLATLNSIPARGFPEKNTRIQLKLRPHFFPANVPQQGSS